MDHPGLMGADGVTPLAQCSFYIYTCKDSPVENGDSSLENGGLGLPFEK